MKFIVKDRRKFNYMVLITLLLLQVLAIFHILQIKAHISGRADYGLKDLLGGP